MLLLVTDVSIMCSVSTWYVMTVTSPQACVPAVASMLHINALPAAADHHFPSVLHHTLLLLNQCTSGILLPSLTTWYCVLLQIPHNAAFFVGWPHCNLIFLGRGSILLIVQTCLCANIVDLVTEATRVATVTLPHSCVKILHAFAACDQVQKIQAGSATQVSPPVITEAVWDVGEFLTSWNFFMLSSKK